MRNIKFANLADYLRHGREIEFVYAGKEYSITNHTGFWYLCNDTEQLILSKCRFDEADVLIEQVAQVVLNGKTVAQIFDGGLYDAERLSVL